MSHLLRHIVLFANANGGNEYLTDFLKVLATVPDLHLSVIGLSEQIPIYSTLFNKARKVRYEEILEEAARVAADQLAHKARQHG